MLVYHNSNQPNGWIRRKKQRQRARTQSLSRLCIVFLQSSAPFSLPGKPQKDRSNLSLASVDDGGLLGGLDLAGTAADGLERLDNELALLVGNLAEDDVAAIEPLSLDGGDEELRAVAVWMCQWWWDFAQAIQGESIGDIRVGASVGHGQQEGLGVLLLEVLVGKLLAVDGLATGALEEC